MIDIGGQREEPLEGVGDVGFNLLRRHAVVERGHHDDGHVDAGEQIHRHAGNVDRANQRHNQAQHEDEEWKSESKLRHYFAPPLLASSRFHSRSRLPTRASHRRTALE